MAAKTTIVQVSEIVELGALDPAGVFGASGFREGDLVADLTSKLVDNHDVADGDLLLTAAGLDDRVDHLNAHLCRFFERLSRAARL